MGGEGRRAGGRLAGAGGETGSKRRLASELIPKISLAPFKQPFLRWKVARVC